MPSKSLFESFSSKMFYHADSSLMGGQSRLLWMAEILRHLRTPGMMMICYKGLAKTKPKTSEVAELVRFFLGGGRFLLVLKGHQKGTHQQLGDAGSQDLRSLAPKTGHVKAIGIPLATAPAASWRGHAEPARHFLD